MNLEEIIRLIKKIEPFIAIAILFTLLFLSFLLYQDNKLKKEISQNCGWAEEDYKCYCEHSKINEIINSLGGDINIILENDSMDN